MRVTDFNEFLRLSMTGELRWEIEQRIVGVMPADQELWNEWTLRGAIRSALTSLETGVFGDTRNPLQRTHSSKGPDGNLIQASAEDKAAGDSGKEEG